MNGRHSARARRLNRIMKQVAGLLAELKELEGELPIPSAEEFQGMVKRRELTFDAFFLAYVGALHFHLDEAVNALWSWLKTSTPARFHKSFAGLPELFPGLVEHRVAACSGVRTPVAQQAESGLRERLSCLEDLPEQAQRDIVKILDAATEAYFMAAEAEVAGTPVREA